MPAVARLSLEHWRCQRFRPIAILEYAVGFLCVLCLLPLIVIAVLFTESDLELPNIKTRFYRRWHELRLILLDARGQVVSFVDHVPANAEEGHAVLASVLAAADRERLVVVESIVAGAVREVAEVWYGGRPLLAHPDELSEERAAAVLQQHGVEVRRGAGEVEIIETAPPIGSGARVLAWILLPLVLIVSPVLFWTPNGRRALRHGWADLLGRGGRPRVVVSVRAESVATRHERDGERWDEQVVDGRELFGITVSPTLGYDEAVTRSPASLRLVLRRGVSALPLRRAEQAQQALRDLVVSATLRLRAERPELGLLGPGPVPTRCPFCAALYLMEPGSRCPSCGAHAGTTP